MTSSTPFPKKQHYIPQFYLKNFSQDGKFVHIYDRAKGNKGEMRYQTTIQVAHENHLYTYKTKKGTKKNLEALFSQFEGDAAAIIEKVHRDRVITPEEKEKLALFVGFLYTRTPSFKHMSEKIQTKIGEKVARMMFRITPKEWIRKTLKEKEGKDYTNEELDNFMDIGANPKRSRIAFKYPQGWWIKLMLDMGLEAAKIFYGMDWLFLFTSQPYAFLTSDNPFLLIPPENYNRFYGFGLITPKTQKVIPLRADMCLMMGDLNESPVIKFVDTTKEFYKSINTYTLIGSERYCFSPDKGKLEKLVKEIKPYDIPKMPKVRTV